MPDAVKNFVGRRRSRSPTTVGNEREISGRRHLRIIKRLAARVHNSLGFSKRARVEPVRRSAYKYNSAQPPFSLPHCNSQKPVHDKVIRRREELVPLPRFLVELGAKLPRRQPRTMHGRKTQFCRIVELSRSRKVDASESDPDGQVELCRWARRGEETAEGDWCLRTSVSAFASQRREEHALGNPNKMG